MAATARGDVLQSPWSSRFADYQDKAITITVTFNNATRSITGGSITRDAGCAYTKVLIGLGGDGRPDSTDKVFNVAGLEGTQSANKAAFTARGFDTIEQIQALQITASP
jgi:hypothetical protein